MDNVTFVISEIDGSEYAIIDKGNGEFVSMLKSTYEAEFGLTPTKAKTVKAAVSE
jgi:hypothetical protein